LINNAHFISQVYQLSIIEMSLDSPATDDVTGTVS